MHWGLIGYRSRYFLRATSATRMAAKKLTFHYLSEQDIVKTGLTLSESIELCMYAFKEHGEKLVENPPKIAIHPLPDAFLHAMPGRNKHTGY